jgi:hypothetical protein
MMTRHVNIVGVIIVHIIVAANYLANALRCVNASPNALTIKR